MPEAVIVATARSPIGRANKGSMTTMRPDDLAAQIVQALMAKVPQVGAASRRARPGSTSPESRRFWPDSRVFLA